MPGIYDRGAELLLRNTPLGSEEWRILIESRRGLLKDYLDRFTLQRLEEVECLRQESHHHSIGNDSPKVEADPGFNLASQGIFVETYSTYHRRESPSVRVGVTQTTTTGGIVHLWGLSRKAEWLIIEVRFTREPGYKDRGYDRATMVTIKAATLDEILGISRTGRESVWAKLGEAVASMVEQRRRLYVEAERLLAIIKAQNAAVDHIDIMTSEELVSP